MATTLSTTIYEYAPQAEDGFLIGSASADKVGFYGKAPAAQRAYSSALLASLIVTSASFGAQQAAALLEVVNILKDVGLAATA
jgi:hypothetical protein